MMERVSEPMTGVRAVARVNLAAIERNCAQLTRASPLLCAVVKANAYGHGAVECSRAALAAEARRGLRWPPPPRRRSFETPALRRGSWSWGR